MSGPVKPAVIQGTDFVATVLLSVEVSSVFVWDVPGVKSFTARRSLLSVVRMDTRNSIRVCLLAIERISHKHRLIDLRENPLSFGNHLNVLTSKGRNQGDERMRILFYQAAAAQDFVRRVEDILQRHPERNELLTGRAVNDHTRPTEAVAAMPSTPSTSSATSPPREPGQAGKSVFDMLGKDVNASSCPQIRPTEAVAVMPSTPSTPSATLPPKEPGQVGKSVFDMLDNRRSNISPPASQETDRLSPGILCSATVSGSLHEQALSSVTDRLRLLTTAVSQLMADRVEDRRIQAEERRALETTIVDLTANVAALKENACRNPREFQDMTPLAVLQVMQHALSSLLLVNERDNTSQDPHAVRQSMTDPVRGLEVAKARFAVLSPETGRHFRPLPRPPIPSPLYPSTLSLPSYPIAANVPRQTQHSKRHGPEVSSPSASKRPRPSSTSGSSTAITLLVQCTSGNDLTTVRFGRVEWVADVHQLRAQVYIMGKVAWDSVSALYATLRSVSRDEEEREYACLEFPARGLAEMFVKAWATHRVHAEDWAEAQAWIV